MSHHDDAQDDSHDDHAGIGHVAPLKALLGTGTALLILTWFTVFIASFNFGELFGQVGNLRFGFGELVLYGLTQILVFYAREVHFGSWL